MVFKLRSKPAGKHIHMTVFAGPDDAHLANCGYLAFELGEWQLFGACVGLGAAEASKATTKVSVIHEGDDDVVSAMSSKEDSE